MDRWTNVETPTGLQLKSVEALFLINISIVQICMDITVNVIPKSAKRLKTRSSELNGKMILWFVNIVLLAPDYLFITYRLILCHQFEFFYGRPMS